MTITSSRPSITYVPQMAPERIGAFIKETAQKAGLQGPPQLIVCYFARSPCEEYQAIKVRYKDFDGGLQRAAKLTYAPYLQRFGDLDVGVATQGLNIPKAKRGNPQCELDFRCAVCLSR